jgi:hypothetical protein
MEQREVMDAENTNWTCVQAYAGLGGEAAEKATELAGTDGGQVTVVCTPSGGAQTVRLELNPDWLEAMPDEELLRAIAEKR